MPLIDPRFVLSPPWELYFVDKTTGEPLAAGKVYTWEDENRNIPKPLYKIVDNGGNPPVYTYVPLPNPSTLTGVGTFADDTGADIVPYFYPFEGDPSLNNNMGSGIPELYFIQVFDSQANLQWTREAYPGIEGEGGGGGSIINQLVNFIPNGQFLAHNNVPATPTTMAGQINQTSTSIAPGGWSFERSPASTATDFVKFVPFGSFVPTPPGSPEYYVNIIDTIPGSDSVKDLTMTWADVNKFSSPAASPQVYTFGIWAQATAPTAVSLYLEKNFGMGGSSPAITLLTTFNLTTSWQLFTFSFTPGDNTAFTEGTGSNIQLRLRMPASIAFNVSFTDAMFFIGNISPVGFPTTIDTDFFTRGVVGFTPTPDPNGFDLYLPFVRTPQGDIPDHTQVGKIMACGAEGVGIGELACDGTGYTTVTYSSTGVANPLSSPDGIPYQRLGNYLFNQTSLTPRWGTSPFFVTSIPNSNGITNRFVVHTNTAGAASNATDGGTPTGFTFAPTATGFASYFVNSYFISAVSSAHGAPPGFLWQGYFAGTVTAPVIGPGAPFSLITTWTNEPLTKAAFLFSITGIPTAGQYFTIYSLDSTATLHQFNFWYSVNGSGGTGPSVGGTNVQINIFTASDNAIVVAQKTANVMSGFTDTDITTTPGSAVTAGTYFNLPAFGGATTNYYVWLLLNGTGTDPLPGGTGIAVNILTADTAAQVATKVITAINSYSFAVPNLAGVTLKGYDPTGLVDTVLRYDAVDDLTGASVGSFQLDTIQQHFHTNTFGINSSSTNTSLQSPASPSYQIGLEFTQNTGMAQTTVLNAAVNYIIKY